MIIHNCIQGTPQWLQLRAGIPTASRFDEILTPGGKPSKSADKYLDWLLAERMMHQPIVQAVSTWMDRGSQLEAEAVSYYEFQRDTETVKVGFITRDDGKVGASPDRLVGDCGLLEIKCPSPSVHVGYLRAEAGISDAYKPQVQGQLWVCEKQWSDTLSFHPEMPPALIRIERDDAYIALLEEAVLEFSDRLERMAAEFRDRGWIKDLPAMEPAADLFGITDEDIAALMADRFPGVTA